MKNKRNNDNIVRESQAERERERAEVKPSDTKKFSEKKGRNTMAK